MRDARWLDRAPLCHCPLRARNAKAPNGVAVSVRLKSPRPPYPLTARDWFRLMLCSGPPTVLNDFAVRCPQQAANITGLLIFYARFNHGAKVCIRLALVHHKIAVEFGMQDAEDAGVVRREFISHRKLLARPFALCQHPTPMLPQ